MSSAVRAQAVDYLLKPIAEDTLEKLLFKLKERFVALQQERLQNSVTTRIHQILPESAPGELEAVKLGICLFCAGALPQRIDIDLLDHVPKVWQKLSLTASAKALCGNPHMFLQEFSGDFPAIRILVFKPESADSNDWVRLLYEEIAAQSELPVSCICLSDTTTVTEIGRTHKKLHQLLAAQIVIGQSAFHTIDAATLTAVKADRNDFAGDADAAAVYAGILNGKDSCAIMHTGKCCSNASGRKAGHSSGYFAFFSAY